MQPHMIIIWYIYLSGYLKSAAEFMQFQSRIVVYSTGKAHFLTACKLTQVLSFDPWTSSQVGALLGDG